ncbi:MAG: FCD domain-containing protein [Muribaculaceae bacterium]
MENKKIEEPKDSTLVEQTQNKILEYISENHYEFNSVLPKESELAEILGVSRVVIREAYSGLRVLGFLETKRKKGTIFVAPKVFNILKFVMLSGFMDKQSMKDMYELRLMLEIGMSDYVVPKVTDSKIEKLQKIVDREEEATTSEDLRLIDIKFHSALYEMSSNRSLLYFQNILSKLFYLYTPRSADWKAHEMMTHRTLLEILKKKNPELFRAAMRIHLENQFKNQERNLSYIKK